jgi:hypothetical protein
MSGAGNVPLQPANIKGAEFDAVGGVLSLTVNVFVVLAVFPQTSVAVKVTVTILLQLFAGAV